MHNMKKNSITAYTYKKDLMNIYNYTKHNAKEDKNKPIFYIPYIIIQNSVKDKNRPIFYIRINKYI